MAKSKTKDANSKFVRFTLFVCLAFVFMLSLWMLPYVADKSIQFVRNTGVSTFDYIFTLSTTTLLFFASILGVYKIFIKGFSDKIEGFFMFCVLASIVGITYAWFFFGGILGIFLGALVVVGLSYSLWKVW